MKLAFSSLGCPEIPVMQLPQLAATYGFHGVELRGALDTHVHPTLDRAGRREVRESFQRERIAVVGVTGYTKFGTSDADVLAAQIQGVCDVAELAADLGGTYIRTFFGGGTEDGAARDHYTAAADALFKAAEYAESVGVTLLVETHDTVSSTREAMDLVNLVEHPGLGVLWDVAHSVRTGERVEEGWSRVRSRIGYLHLKDERSEPDGRLAHMLPGSGSIPIREIVKAVQSDGYDGWYCLEWERMWHPEMPPIAEALVAFRRLLDAVPPD